MKKTHPILLPPAPKTKMTIKHPPFEDVFPIENKDFPMLVFRGVSPFSPILFGRPNENSELPKLAVFSSHHPAPDEKRPNGGLPFPSEQIPRKFKSAPKKKVLSI